MLRFLVPLVAGAVAVTAGLAVGNAIRPPACDAAYVAAGLAAVTLLDAERANAAWRAQQSDNRLDGDPAWATAAERYERAYGFVAASLARCAGGLAYRREYSRQT